MAGPQRVRGVAEICHAGAVARLLDSPVLTGRSGRVRAARQLTAVKQRRARGQFLAEGPQSVGSAVDTGAAVEVFVAVSAMQRRSALLEQARTSGVAVYVAADDAVAGLTSATSPQGVVAVCRREPLVLADVLAHGEPGQVALAHEMADPGNCGALIRVADAVGAIGVVLSEGSVDPTNPKCVRASAGSLFHLPVVEAGATIDVVQRLRSADFRVLAADVSSDAADLFVAERAGLLSGRVCWVFGNEAHGLSASVLDVVDHVVRIPILGRAESLNVATASAVCLYAYARAHEEEP